LPSVEDVKALWNKPEVETDAATEEPSVQL